MVVKAQAQVREKEYHTNQPISVDDSVQVALAEM
jgi:hypothetical protein